jgi:TRAP-type C4-dicarboxylate transport system permease large subunit
VAHGNWGLANGFVMAGLLWGIPCWLIVRTWHKYRRWNLATETKSTLAGLSLWVLLYPLALLSKGIREKFSTPRESARVNFLLCFAALFLSTAIPQTLEGVTPIRGALMAASAYMPPTWMFRFMAG